MNTTEPVTIHNATKLWQLLELAINDAEALQNNPRYKLDMHAWHDGIGISRLNPSVCYVCMAGAVMARQLAACDVPSDKLNEELARLCKAAEDDAARPQLNNFKAHKELAAKLKELDI